MRVRVWAISRSPRLELAAIGVGLAVMALAVVWLVRRWRRPTPEALERLRRLRLNQMGRITGGEILDAMPALVNGKEAAGLPPSLVYQYQVSGVTYEASQALHLVAAELDPGSWIPGWPVQVKFDPANPGNSIIACEHWSGLTAAGHTRAATTSRGGSAPAGKLD